MSYAVGYAQSERSFNLAVIHPSKSLGTKFCYKKLVDFTDQEIEEVWKETLWGDSFKKFLECFRDRQEIARNDSCRFLYSPPSLRLTDVFNEAVGIYAEQPFLPKEEISALPPIQRINYFMGTVDLPSGFRVSGLGLPSIETVPCQFCDCKVPSGISWTIENLGSGEKLDISGLNRHFIDDHDYCGPPGTPYRLDPEVARHVLRTQ